MEEIKLWLPNRHGNYSEVILPKYMDDVVFERRYGKCHKRIVEIGPYKYRISGWNASRPAYGVEADAEKLKHFLERFAKFEDGTRLETLTNIQVHKERKNYYVTFSMVDPWALAFERAGLVEGY